MSVDRVSFYAKKYGIPEGLARALIGQESGGRAGAVSPAGATGLTQVMPGTAAGMYGISEQEAAAKLRDPEFALDAGMRYLAKQKQDFGSWRLALAAYNAGPNAVKKYGGVPPYAETQNYVRNILGRAGAPPSRVEQTVARQAHNLEVAGSSPAPATRMMLGNPVQESAGLGLESLRAGTYDPTKQLQGLLASAQAPQGLTEAPVASQAPPTMPAQTGDWHKWVTLSKTADRTGTSTQAPVLQFVGDLGMAYGKPISIGTGTNHNEYTVNGRVSDHWRGMAADVPASGKTLRRLGYLALLNAGMSKKDALKAQRTGGLFNVGRYQIIFATKEGGNHFNHLHVGLRDH